MNTGLDFRSLDEPPRDCECCGTALQLHVDCYLVCPGCGWTFDLLSADGDDNAYTVGPREPAPADAGRMPSGPTDLPSPFLTRERFRLAHRLMRRAWPPAGSEHWGAEVVLVRYLPDALQSAALKAAHGSRLTHIGAGYTADPLHYPARSRLAWRRRGCGVHL